MNVEIINESSRHLPGDLINAISEFRPYDEVNDIAEEYNLRIVSLRFVNDENDLPIEQEITVGDRA
jgi:hypothetical protein